MMKRILINTLKIISIFIAFILITAFVLIAVEARNSKNNYHGGQKSNSKEWCDYGYKRATKSCCDEDDYSCEVCDLYGIYCETKEIFQGEYSDIETFPTLYPNGDSNCAIFHTWEEAQKVFIRDGGPKKDPYQLDEDNDGIACEALKK